MLRRFSRHSRRIEEHVEEVVGSRLSAVEAACASLCTSAVAAEGQRLRVLGVRMPRSPTKHRVSPQRGAGTGNGDAKRGNGGRPTRASPPVASSAPQHSTAVAARKSRSPFRRGSPLRSVSPTYWPARPQMPSPLSPQRALSPRYGSGPTHVDDPHWRWRCFCTTDVDVSAVVGGPAVGRFQRGYLLELLERRETDQGLLVGRCVEGWVSMRVLSQVRKVAHSTEAAVFLAWVALRRATRFQARQTGLRVFRVLVRELGVYARRLAWERYQAQSHKALLPPPPDQMDITVTNQWHEEHRQR